MSKDKKDKKAKKEKKAKQVKDEQLGRQALQEPKELKVPKDQQRPKPLCKWDKDDIKENLDRLKTLVVPPRFICGKCGRVATERGYLCKPVEL